MDIELTRRGQLQLKYVPSDKYIIQAFWGLANYYQYYITNVWKVRVPLNNFLK